MIPLIRRYKDFKFGVVSYKDLIKNGILALVLWESFETLLLVPRDQVDRVYLELKEPLAEVLSRSMRPTRTSALLYSKTRASVRIQGYGGREGSARNGICGSSPKAMYILDPELI